MFTRESGKLESLIGVNSEFQGELHVKGTLRVDGRIDGQVYAECVILSESGAINGDVNAKKIIVGGRIEGNLRAQEIVEIKTRGKVAGEIFTPKIAITEGGEFNGKIDMKMDQAKLLEFEAKNPEGLDLKFGGNQGVY
jgi:cytoskeletal protein CcmA (bactofilin family)